MVGYFDDLSALIGADQADPSRLDQIAWRHGMEVVGSVPERATSRRSTTADESTVSRPVSRNTMSS
jgi:hypothetical protein